MLTKIIHLRLEVFHICSYPQQLFEIFSNLAYPWLNSWSTQTFIICVLRGSAGTKCHRGYGSCNPWKISNSLFTCPSLHKSCKYTLANLIMASITGKIWGDWGTLFLQIIVFWCFSVEGRECPGSRAASEGYTYPQQKQDYQCHHQQEHLQACLGFMMLSCI